MVRFRTLAMRNEARKKNCQMVKICRRSKPITNFGNHWSVRLIDLLGEDEKIFAELSNENLKQKFLQQAEDEGFVINGKMPTNQKAESVMIVHNNYTITYLRGFVAHLEYYHFLQALKVF